MKITLEKIKDGWRADCKDLPGSPPCGDATTKEMAIAHLFYRLLNDSLTDWRPYIKFDNTLTINGKPWKAPKWYFKK